MKRKNERKRKNRTKRENRTKTKNRIRGKKRRGRFLWRKTAVVLSIVGVFVLVLAGAAARKHEQKDSGRTKEAGGPEERLVQYMNYIPERKYEEMYKMVNLEEYGKISQEDFVKRNAAIYEGIEVENLEIEIISYQKERETVTYQTSFDTIGGKISFENEAYFQKGENGYELVWDDSMIFPELGFTDKVRVSTIQAERGEILDRNGGVLAGKGTASSVGVVLGKLENREEAVQQMAALLEVEPESIEKKLSVSWAKDDSFIPIQTLPKLKEAELMPYEKSGIERVPLEPDEKLLAEKERQEKLLEIPGVILRDTQVREYPLGKSASHLTGYVQNVTAEDLEAHPGEGYTADSVIGRSGIEGLFEKELRGQKGCRIYIADSTGREKKVLADQAVQHGQNIQLTIDADLQTALYEQFQEDKSCSVAMNPYTGEVLALVSTPSYDSNDFIMGFSKEQWTALNEDEKKPLYNRFRQVWCPGSAFKPVTAAIGLESGAIDPAEDYGEEGLRWQKDGSWGSYYVTTLHTYRPVILENALIYSDNIYFAKAALKIGAEEMTESLSKLGFQQELPFEITMAKSRYSNTETIETEIQLADSGYGQGQILINPLHMACIYSAFCNEGNMIRPSLIYSGEKSADYWIPKAFSKETAGQVSEGTKKVVNDPNGTGYRARREDVVLAGKTGTAEIKDSQSDDSGTELGWFAVYTPEKNTEHPILLISMTEDVKERGGSGYVVEKNHLVLEKWFGE